MTLFYQPEITPQFQLLPEEAHHAIKVLRLTIGEEIHLINGKGTMASARITKITKTECFGEVIHAVDQPKRKYFIHLAIAPTKNNDRIEWMVEKCIELGIDAIHFITTKHSERKKINLDRVRKIVVAAMKQSQQAWLPEIEECSFVTSLQLKSDQKFIAHVDSANPALLKNLATPAKSYTVLIGPEGDFAPSEITEAIEQGFQKVSLGPNRLRTETAGLAACHILNLANQG